MKNKLIVLLIAIIYISTACSHEKKETYITKGEAFRAIALSLVTKPELDIEDSEEKSFLAYAKYLYDNTIIGGAYSEGELENALSYMELREIYANMEANATIDTWLSQNSEQAGVSLENFYTFYEYWLEEKNTNQYVSLVQDVLYGIAKTKDTDIIQFYSHDSGIIRYITFGEETSYLDKELRFFLAGDELLYIKEVVSETVSYTGVLITGIKENAIDVLIYGVEREFILADKALLEIFVEEAIADVTIDGGEISEAKLISTKISAKVLSVGEQTIELEGYGSLSVAEDFSSYIQGSFLRESLKRIRVGSENHDFYVEENTILAAIRNTPYTYENVRVLVMNNHFSLDHHFTLTMHASSGLYVRIGDEVEQIPPGESYSISNDSIIFDTYERIFIEALEEGDLISLDSVERGYGTPVYPGTFEIIKRDGALYLINEVEVEEYLCRVIPSEMPPSYHIEALKAQAVSARTYVYRQMEANGVLRTYGASVDDSINYQVYNNVSTDAKTDEAVEKTAYQVIFYGDSLAETFYYSTSAGVSTDASIWGNDAANYPYLTSHGISPKRESMNLTTNADFLAFLKDDAYDAYEKDYPFYRWRTTTTNKILNDENTRVGNILNISITMRGEGGIAKKMRIDGSDGSYTISGQNAIRAALGSESLVIEKQDGTQVSGWSSLPSSFLAIEVSEPDENNVITFTIYGGGYGHGVGMSQNGAQEMALSGMDYTQIIDFFYDGISLEEMD